MSLPQAYCNIMLVISVSSEIEFATLDLHDTVPHWAKSLLQPLLQLTAIPTMTTASTYYMQSASPSQ